MTDILKNWITNRLGVVLEFSPEVIGHNIRDGRLIANLLYSYNIITRNQLRVIVPTDEVYAARANLKHISTWIRCLNLECDDSLYEDVANGRSSAAIQLLYQLFLKLNSQGSILCTHPGSTRFDVTEVDEDALKGTMYTPNPLAQPLIHHKDLITWYRNKYQQLDEQMEARREQLRKLNIPKPTPADIKSHPKMNRDERQQKCYEEFCEAIRKFEKEHPPDMKDLTFEELFNMLKNNSSEFKCDPSKADAILQHIKMKFRSQVAARKYKTKLEKLLAHELWEDIMKKQEEEFDKSVAEKTLKQSDFEKKMMTKCFEVRNQKRIINENRIFVTNLLEKQREEEFSKVVLEHNEQMSRERLRYSQERERQLELHKRLYCERLCRQHKEDCEFCLTIVQGYVDFAIRVGEYHKLYDDDVPRHLLTDWTVLVRKGQSLFPYITEEEQVISETPGPVEELVKQELDRQGTLNSNDLQEYLKLDGQWRLDELFEEEDIPDIPRENGFNILSHIIHRVLLYKYPLPPPLQPPELPAFKIRSCVVNINDFTMINILQELLLAHKIVILDIEHAINFCLKQFQDDMLGLEDVQIRFLEETVYAVDPQLFPTDVIMVGDRKNGESIPVESDEKPQPSPPPSPPKSEKKGGKGGKGGKGAEPAAPPPVIKVEKVTQTPKTLPEPLNADALSEAATLGKCAYELLNLGQPLTDFVTGAMLIAYLKTLTDVDGWVLINYPTTIDQTNILEMVLTGDNPGISDGMDEQDLIPATSSILFQDSFDNIPDSIDPNRLKRISNLIGSHNMSLEFDDHETYLTSYITAYYEQVDLSERNLLNEYTDTTSPIDYFYTEQGVRYIFRYNVFDFKSIVQLAKLIIGDFSLPPKTSEELFGDTYKELKDKYDNNADLEGLPSATKSTVRGTPSYGMDEMEGEYEGFEMEKYEIQPGDTDWTYLALPIDYKISVGIATLWENMEITYLADITELFAIKRNHRNTVVPYITYLKNHMTDFKSRPDTKQTVLQEFQFQYNDISDDLRNDEEVKSELHCRINELRKALWDISDQRMEECEEERRRLINDNWITEQLVFLTNQFIALFQLELNRCADTLQTIQDYYLSMLNVPINPTNTLNKSLLPKIEIIKKPAPVFTESGTELPLIYNPDDTKEYTSQGIAIITKIAAIFMDHNEVALDATNFVGYIQNTKNISLKQTAEWETICMKIYNENKQVAPKKPPKKGAVEEPPTIDPEERERLLQEWSVCLEGEIGRMRLHLPVIEKKALDDLAEIFNYGETTFHTIYENISAQYEREIHSINQVCELFGRAVEDEKKIQFELVLNDDKFYVCGDTVLYTDELLTAEHSLQERIPEGEFSVDQLRKLYDIFYDLAPNGSIPERVLTFVLQDLLFLDTDDGYHQDFPELWQRLNTIQLTKIIDEFFGDPEYVDWRDFLIYNMGIPFPDEKAILKAWMTYALYDDKKEELINRKYYNYVRLWFEKDPKPSEADVSTRLTFSNDELENAEIEYADEEELLRIERIKALLFDLYEARNGYVNYTGLLLGFCKDVNPVLGLTKALSLALKSLIGWDPIEGVRQEEKDREKYLRGGVDIVLEGESRSTIGDYNCVCGDVTIIDINEDESAPYLQSEPSTLPSVHSDINQPLNQLFVDQPKWQMDEDIIEELKGESQGRSFVSLALAHMYSDEELRMYKDRAYLLPFQAAFMTLGAALPWHIRTQCVDNNTLCEMLERVFYDLRQTHCGPMRIYIYKFLQHPIIKELLSVCNKFFALYPPVIIKKYVEN